MRHLYDKAFDDAALHVRTTLKNRLIEGAHLFTTNSDPEALYAAYLNGFGVGSIEPGEPGGPTIRQFHHCNCCRRFIQKFGGLVVIDPTTGQTQSALWGTSPGSVYTKSFRALAAFVAKSSVTGVFSTDATMMGEAEAGGHNHFAVPTPSQCLKRDPTPWSALKREDMGTLKRALQEYPPALITKALGILQSGNVSGAEKVIGNAEFLLETHAKIDAVLAFAPNRRIRLTPDAENVLWTQVAKAPNGWCSPRTNMIGNFMDDLAKGVATDTAIRSFAAKMDGLSYQRPTEAPKAGTVTQANRVFEKLGLQAALIRRFASIDDVELLWRSRIAPPPVSAKRKPVGGLFGGVPIKEHKPTPALTAMVGTTAITFEKFRRTVLPGVRTMQLFCEAAKRADYGALTTAVDPAAPLLFQWDNPVSPYRYDGGSLPTQWMLGYSTRWVDVEGLTLMPWMWEGASKQPLTHHAAGGVFILKDARDRSPTELALFPSFMRSDLHEVRSVIEAYSKTNRINPINGQHATGMMIGSGGKLNVLLRVSTDTVIQDYLIDRWD